MKRLIFLLAIFSFNLAVHAKSYECTVWEGMVENKTTFTAKFKESLSHEWVNSLGEYEISLNHLYNPGHNPEYPLGLLEIQFVKVRGVNQEMSYQRVYMAQIYPQGKTYGRFLGDYRNVKNEISYVCTVH